MIKLTAMDGTGHWVALPHPESLLLWRETEAPADLLEVVFFVELPLPQLEEVVIERDGVRWFGGVVDEQNTVLSKNGVQVELVCRSLEAILLDNEAKPETMLSPSLKRLEEKLLTPVGLQLGEGDTARTVGEFVIEKGESAWSVLARFCEAVLGVTPYLTPQGLLQCAAVNSQDFALDEVLSAEYSELPCKRIHEVWQQSCRGQYDTRYCAKDAEGKKPRAMRRRYLSRERTQSASQMLQQSSEKSRLLSVTCRGAVLPQKWDTASVKIAKLGEFFQWQVQRVRYCVDRQGESTTLLLAPPKETEG